jgi:hypothetical protein
VLVPRLLLERLLLRPLLLRPPLLREELPERLDRDRPEDLRPEDFRLPPLRDDPRDDDDLRDDDPRDDEERDDDPPRLRADFRPRFAPPDRRDELLLPDFLRDPRLEVAIPDSPGERSYRRCIARSALKAALADRAPAVLVAPPLTES